MVDIKKLPEPVAEHAKESHRKALGRTQDLFGLSELAVRALKAAADESLPAELRDIHVRQGDDYLQAIIAAPRAPGANCGLGQVSVLTPEHP